MLTVYQVKRMIRNADGQVINTNTVDCYSCKFEAIKFLKALNCECLFYDPDFEFWISKESDNVCYWIEPIAVN